MSDAGLVLTLQEDGISNTHRMRGRGERERERERERKRERKRNIIIRFYLISKLSECLPVMAHPRMVVLVHVRTLPSVHTGMMMIRSVGGVFPPYPCIALTAELTSPLLIQSTREMQEIVRLLIVQAI
jgi:hypothetical protein